MMQPVQRFNRSEMAKPDRVRPALLSETISTLVVPFPSQFVAPKQVLQTLRNEASGESIDEQLFVALADAKVWTSRVAMHLDIASRDRIFRQLDVLHEVDEWAEGDKPVALASYKSFIRAIVVHQISSRPALALMPNGNILAEWSDENDKLTIEFLADNRTRWLVQNNTPEGPERAGGTSPLERLRNNLQPYGAERWFNGS